MKKKWLLLLLAIIALVFASPFGLSAHADGVYNPPGVYLDESTLPTFMYVGDTGQVRPLQDSVIKDFQNAYIYTLDKEGIISIDEQGHWKALQEGQVTVSIQSAYGTGRFSAELKKYNVQIPEFVRAIALVKTFNITVLPANSRGGNVVYRPYHPGLQVHLYTADLNEYQVLGNSGWTQEGVAWRSSQSGQPVYRMYNEGLKVHLYTMDANEYVVLATRGWRQEGVAYHSAGQIPVYRLYHEGIKKHLYTRDTNEKNVLSTQGWRYEGVAWNVQE